MRHCPICSAQLMLVWLLFISASACSTVSDKERTTSVLLDQFETVFAAPTELLTSGAVLRGVAGADAQWVRKPFANLLLGLESQHRDFQRASLAAGNRAFVGAKDFRAPRALGTFESVFCYVVQFARNREVLPPAGLTVNSSVRGLSVVAWTSRLSRGEGETATLYAAKLRNEYIAMSNDLGALEAVAEALTHDGGRQLLGPSTGCQATKDALYWGCRRYRIPTDRKGDPSTLGLGAEAEGLSLVISGTNAELRLFAKDTHEPVPPIKAGLGLPEFARISGREWSATFKLDGSNASAERLFTVMGLFGFGVYL